MNKKILLFIILIAICVFSFFYFSEKPAYIDENNNFEIRVGEEFSFLLNENKSTGYEYCWLNRFESQIVQSIKKSYSIHNTNKDGGGGTTHWTFKGVKKGQTIIKLCKCPTMVQGKNCSDYKLEECPFPLTINVTVD